MLVTEIMHQILSCDENVDLHDAAKKMAEKERGSIIITRKGVPVGIFTERDAVRMLAQRKDTHVKIKQVMSTLKFFANENMSLEEASRIMEQNNIRRLPIQDKNGKLIGMVTAASITKSKKYLMARDMASISRLAA